MQAQTYDTYETITTGAPARRWQWNDACWDAARREGISGTALNVLLYLGRAVRWDPDDPAYGIARLRAATLGAAVSASGSSVRRAVKRLADAGLLVYAMGSGRTPSEFRLTLAEMDGPGQKTLRLYPGADLVDAEEPEPGEKNVDNPPAGVSECTPRGVKMEPQGCQNGTPRAESILIKGSKRNRKNDMVQPTPDLFVDKEENVEKALDAYAAGANRRDAYRLAVKSWNDLAAECGLPRVKVLTSQRKKWIARWGAEVLENWPEIAAIIRGSKFLCGDNDRHWRLDFDGLWGRENIRARLLEGNYSPPASTPTRKVRQRFCRHGMELTQAMLHCEECHNAEDARTTGERIGA